MALFIDAAVPTVQDLLAYDRNLLEIAGTEGLDCDEKLTLARGQVGSSLEAFLRSEDYSARLDSIVASELIIRWIAYVTLSLFYRDAHYHQLSDRYRAKWQEYDLLAREARGETFASGVGFISNPLPRPAKPSIAVSGGTLPVGSYFIRTSWTGADNSESEVSESSSHLLEASGALDVMSAAAPVHAYGWNVYAGITEDMVTRQNAQPLGLTQSTFRLDQTIVAGAFPGGGQKAQSIARHRNILRRG